MFPYRFIESQKFVHTRLFAARATERVSKSNTLAYELPNGNWALSTRMLLMLVAWCVHVCVLFFLLKSLVLYTYLTGFRYHAFWILCACLCAVFIFLLILLLFLSCMNQMFFFWIHFNTHYSFMGINCCWKHIQHLWFRSFIQRVFLFFTLLPHSKAFEGKTCMN